MKQVVLSNPVPLPTIASEDCTGGRYYGVKKESVKNVLLLVMRAPYQFYDLFELVGNGEGMNVLMGPKDVSLTAVIRRLIKAECEVFQFETRKELLDWLES